jgi:hypothetical protein
MGADALPSSDMETRTGNLCVKDEIELVIFKNATTETGLKRESSLPKTAGKRVLYLPPPPPRRAIRVVALLADVACSILQKQSSIRTGVG